MGGEVFVECELLRYNTELTPRCGSIRRNVVTHYRYAAGAGFEESRDAIEGGAFPGPVGSEQTKDRPGSCFETDTAHSGQVTVLFL